jgi:hypothetical protein
VSRRHLIQDLQPYSCLEIDCPSNGDIFPTRQSWVKHLQLKHGLEAHSPSRCCHLCGEMTDSGMVAICRHFANHLEDIAIAASPMDIDSDDESDTDSMKSHGHLADEKEKLQTIAEDDEEILDTRAEIGARDEGKRPNNSETVLSRTVDVVSGEIQPNCAICNKPYNLPTKQCPCEAERLELAVKQSETRKLDDRLTEIREVSQFVGTFVGLTFYRDWAIRHTRGHILELFSRLTATRKKAHSAYLTSLPHYDIYMRYSGQPPIRQEYIATLQVQIQEANAQLKQGIDSDWRAALLRYPKFLDYYYSLTELRLPINSAPEVANYQMKIEPTDSFNLKHPPPSPGGRPEHLEYERSRRVPHVVLPQLSPAIPASISVQGPPPPPPPDMVGAAGSDKPYKRSGPAPFFRWAAGPIKKPVSTPKYVPIYSEIDSSSAPRRLSDRTARLQSDAPGIPEVVDWEEKGKDTSKIGRDTATSKGKETTTSRLRAMGNLFKSSAKKPEDGSPTAGGIY